MAEGFERLKSSKNWFRVHRASLYFVLNELNDAEFKLWFALRGSAYDFEGQNKGQVRITISSIKNLFNWSQGKSSTILSSLIQKKFVKRIKRGLYYVAQTPQEVQNNEHPLVQLNEQDVHHNEIKIHSNEPSSLKSQSYKAKESYISTLVSPSDEDIEFEKLVDEVLKK